MNNISLFGRLTADPEFKQLQSGPLVNFTLADNTGKDEASFFDCVAFGDNATNIANSCKKGHRLWVVGRMRQRKWQAQDGTQRTSWEMTVSAFQFIEAKEGGQASAAPQPPVAPQGYPGQPPMPGYGYPPPQTGYQQQQFVPPMQGQPPQCSASPQQGQPPFVPQTGYSAQQPAPQASAQPPAPYTASPWS